MKKLFIFAIIGALIFQPIQIKADTTEDITEKLSGETLDAVFEDMKTSMEKGEEVSFGASLDKVGGLYISPDLKYDLSGTSIDMDNLDASLTNLGFSQLTSSLAGSFNNFDLSGNAAGCTELFNAQFGELSLSLNEDNYSIPADFNTRDMLSASHTSINAAYSDVINSKSFQTVKNSISIGNIFASAENGVKQYSLTSETTLKDKLGIDTTKDLKMEYDEQGRWLDGKITGTSDLNGFQQKLNNFFSNDQNYLSQKSQIAARKKQVQENIANQALDGIASGEPSDLSVKAEPSEYGVGTVYTNSAGIKVDTSFMTFNTPYEEQAMLIAHSLGGLIRNSITAEDE